jgi:hypothetical protein
LFSFSIDFLFPFYVYLGASGGGVMAAAANNLQALRRIYLLVRISRIPRPSTHTVKFKKNI